jgi:hypothetical protein
LPYAAGLKGLWIRKDMAGMEAQHASMDCNIK